MTFQADLSCIMCGHFLGEVRGLRAHHTTRVHRFMAGPAFRGAAGITPRRCDKCGGALMLDELRDLVPSALAA